MIRNDSMLTGINRKRALCAYDEVSEYIESIEKCENSDKTNENAEKKFKAILRKLPAIIHNNGLSETMFFLKSKCSKENKPKNTYDYIFESLSNRLCQISNLSKEYFLLELLKADLAEIMFLTNEALDYSSWLKRASEALIEDKEE